METNTCKCPKTQAEAEQIAKMTNSKVPEVKSDTIKDKDRFIDLTRNLHVMARSQPIHKYALVLGLKEMDHVVAVTGDGTNDAPALSKSDVGFAMFAGTDIAKEASDIIIMDNNFSSLVVAIIYGRNIYDNIRKFLQFQLTVNFCACLLVFICACIGNETPLTPIQMLWVNLIMDSLGSLALATEPPYEELLKREPTKRDESIINGKMWKHIIFQSLIQLGILLFLYLHAPHFIKEQNKVRLAENEIIKHCYGKLPGNIKSTAYIIYGTTSHWKSEDRIQHGMDEYNCGEYSVRQNMSVAFKEYMNANGASAHMSIVFNVFVIYTLFNQINARVLDDSFNILVRIHRNLFFPLITLLELALQILIVQFGNAAFKVVENGLTGQQWGISIGFSAITFVLNFIVKLIPLDVCIQNILDNYGKDSKVANIEDLEQQSRENSNQKLMEKNDINLSVEGEGADKKGKRDSNIINPRGIKKGSSLSKGQGSLRQKKADVSITNN
jgi:Ca2+ transporting ATPase